MKVYYQHGGFYHFEQDSELPEGATLLTEVEYLALLDGQSNGKQIVEQKGKPVLVEQQPSPYYEWNGKKWVLPKAQQQAVISAEKSAKLAEINQKAQAFINELAEYDKTPAFERDTWPIQRDEAFAWQADNTKPTPTLDLIALSRGVPVETLRQKAYEKAIAYQQVAAIVSGQRQAYEDKLNATETLEQVQAIKPVYQLPQGENNAQA